jgi:hypothetical protein
LFANDQARITTDPKAVAKALEHPGTPLLRALGSGAPFSLRPEARPHVPTPRAKQKPQRTARQRPLPPQAADRSDLDAADAALRALDNKRERQAADFRREEQALQARREAARADYETARNAAKAAAVAARKAYRNAGGTD